MCDNREPIPSLIMVVEKNKLQNLRLYILSLVNKFTDACQCTITVLECLKCHIHLDSGPVLFHVLCLILVHDFFGP